ncbi:uncharacterized protein LOC142767818 [Rhipicephalus microplus]|uniref:uncharacterized protein LOC142767818 n=1 Tax=Rhipicephalus microplus TaxID=6941 RepID=UPI003F6D9053
MPCKCCVPRCRGNYTVDTKVHVFKFPRDQTLRNAWIRAVPREDLSVTENSRVCELHFREEDIIREASHTDVTTGRTITVPLSHVRLRPDAVPSKFPSFPRIQSSREFKEVAHIVPVHRLDAEFLHKMLKNVICGLEKIGYRVVCVVSDNNSVNRKAMSHFESTPSNRIVYQHPSDPARPLFFVIDPVHILKCIRNNWINQKNDQVCFYFPEMQTDAAQSERMQTASFSTIRDLHSK